MNSKSSNEEFESAVPDSESVNETLERLSSQLELERNYRFYLCMAFLVVGFLFLSLLPAIHFNLQSTGNRFWSGFSVMLVVGPYCLVPTMIVILQKPLWWRLALLVAASSCLYGGWIFSRELILDSDFDFLSSSNADRISIVCIAVVFSMATLFILRLTLRWGVARKPLPDPPTINSIGLAMAAVGLAVALIRYFGFNGGQPLNEIVVGEIISFGIIPGFIFGLIAAVCLFLVCGQKPIPRSIWIVAPVVIATCLLISAPVMMAQGYPFQIAVLVWDAGAIAGAVCLAMPVVILLGAAGLKLTTSRLPE